MNIRYVVGLTEEERLELRALVAAAKTLGQKRKRAQILLACDRGMTDETIAKVLPCGGDHDLPHTATLRRRGPAGRAQREAPKRRQP